MLKKTAAADHVLMQALQSQGADAPAMVEALKRMHEKGIRSRGTSLANRVYEAPKGSSAQIGARKQLARVMAKKPGKVREYIMDKSKGLGDRPSGKGWDKMDMAYFKQKAMQNPRIKKDFLPYGAALRNQVLNKRYAQGEGQGSVVDGMRIPSSDAQEFLDQQGWQDRRSANLYRKAQEMEEQPQFASGMQALGKFFTGDAQLGDVVKSMIT